MVAISRRAALFWIILIRIYGQAFLALQQARGKFLGFQSLLRFTFCWLTIVLLVIWPHYGFAQSAPATVNIPSSRFFSVSPDALSQDKSRLLDQKIKPVPSVPEFILPPLKQNSEQDQTLSSSLHLFIHKIELTGNTIFSNEELATLTQAYENRSVTLEELQDLRQKLTRYYIDRGYINSGAIIPDQKLGAGSLTLQIIEGQLTNINITGNNGLRTSYIDKRIADSLSDPLNINILQQRLLLLQQDPLIKAISAELQPGQKPGESQLNIQIKEARPYQIGLEFSNDRSPSIGSFSGKIWLRHNNLTGFGDAAYFSYGRTEGLDDYNASYTLPLSFYDIQLGAFYQNSQSNVVENPFEQLDIRSRSVTYGIFLKKAFYQTIQQRFSMQLSFEHRRSKTFLLGQAFSFSPGVPELGNDTGESRISVIRFSQNWLDRSQTQVLAFRSTFSFGLDAFDATINSLGVDSHFFSWLGQFQWIRRLPFLDSQAIFRSDVQLSNDPLLPLEKFSVGGQYSVRGYRENQFVRDNGAAVSLEWRVPVFHIPLPGLSQSINDGRVQLATFADFGWTENNELASPGSKTIGSWGIGIRWAPSQKIHTELYWGIPFRKIKQDAEHDIQDSGIHFKMQIQLI